MTIPAREPAMIPIISPTLPLLLLCWSELTASVPLVAEGADELVTVVVEPGKGVKVTLVGVAVGVVELVLVLPPRIPVMLPSTVPFEVVFEVVFEAGGPPSV